jgi:RNA-binding protein YlmH
LGLNQATYGWFFQLIEGDMYFNIYTMKQSYLQSNIDKLQKAEITLNEIQLTKQIEKGSKSINTNKKYI